MVFLREPLGALAPLGPGMGLFDSIRFRLFADITVLFDTASLCSFQSGRWPPLVFAEATAMWAAMVLAMTFPATARRVSADAVWRGLSLSGRVGVFAGGLSFCMLASLAQLGAQMTGLMTSHLRVEWAPAQAIFLLLALSAYCARGRWSRRNPAPAEFGGAFRWTFAALLDCLPMFLLMFPLGLMNVVAMAAMAALAALLQHKRVQK